jgi:hypothetical protein
MLVLLLVLVILVYTLRKEGLTMQYKDICSNFTHKIPDNTQCIHTQVPPQVEKVYNIDFDSPFDRYKKNDINSIYNISYYEDASFNVDIDIAKQSSNNVLPYFKSYTYCDLSNNLPSCVYTTCGIDEVTHRKTVAELMQTHKLKPQSEAIVHLKNNRATYSANYDTYNKASTHYLSSIRNI